MRPSQITLGGIKVIYSNLTVPANSNAQSIQSYQFAGSVTYVDSKIISNPGFQSAFGSYSQGMWAPYVPQWRGTLTGTYRPDDKWSLFAGARVPWYCSRTPCGVSRPPPASITRRTGFSSRRSSLMILGM